MFTYSKVGLIQKPNNNAITKTIDASTIDLTVADRIFERIIVSLATGVFKTLVKKPERLSQTKDMPLYRVVK